MIEQLSFEEGTQSFTCLLRLQGQARNRGRVWNKKSSSFKYFPQPSKLLIVDCIILYLYVSIANQITPAIQGVSEYENTLDS